MKLAARRISSQVVKSGHPVQGGRVSRTRKRKQKNRDRNRNQKGKGSTRSHGLIGDVLRLVAARGTHYMGRGESRFQFEWQRLPTNVLSVSVEHDCCFHAQNHLDIIAARSGSSIDESDNVLGRLISGSPHIQTHAAGGRPHHRAGRRPHDDSRPVAAVFDRRGRHGGGGVTHDAAATTGPAAPGRSQ